MLIRNFLILYGISVLSHQARANTAEAPKSIEAPKTSEPSKKSELYEKSENLRDLKPFYIAGQASVFSGNIPALGIKIGWRSARWALESQYNTFQGVIMIPNFIDSKHENMIYNSFSLEGKFFPSNSFYIGTGLSDEDWNMKVDHTQFWGDNYSKGDEHLNRLTGELFIGNQWENSHATIGIDWVGIGIPLYIFSRTRSGEYYSGGNNGDAPVELYLLRFYVGATF